MSDLFIGPDQADPLEQAAVDAVTGEHTVVRETDRVVRGGMARQRDRRDLLLPALHALQALRGWVSPGGINYVAEVLQVPPAEAYGVATFYELLRTDPPDRPGDLHHVCIDPACLLSGAERKVEELASQGHRVHRAPCLGHCEAAPAVFVQGVDGPDRMLFVDNDGGKAHVMGRPSRVVSRIGRYDPTSLESYRSAGGFRALDTVLREGPGDVLEQLEISGLSGRGGAAFPTATKWRAAAEAAGPRHVVMNADESEPGTFKDRHLLEGDPFAAIEAMIIAGLTVGADRGWIYLRGEYTLAAERLEGALIQCRSAGLIGDAGTGPGGGFDVALRRGACAYICGEETALFNSIEGYRGEPRNKPPFPTLVGLFGRPTVINNPETLFNVLDIVVEGGEAFRSVGTAQSPGTRLFSVSGHVARPGLYELPYGATLREVLNAAGGASGTVRAVLLGGAAGSFVEAKDLDLPLSLEDARTAGVSLGSGVVMVFDDTVDLVPIVVRLAEFFRDESCGQCVPCRVGTMRQHEVMTRAAERGSFADTEGLLEDIAGVMADASICGLGHTAASAVRSALRLGLIGGGST